MSTQPDFTPTDPATWVSLLTVVAAVLSDIFHRSFAGWVPAAATLAAGLVVAFTVLAKHHYRAAFIDAGQAVVAAAPQAPVAVAKAAQTETLLSIAQAFLAAANAPKPADPAPTPQPAAVAAPVAAQPVQQVP